MLTSGRAAGLFGLAAFFCLCVSCKPAQPPEIAVPEKDVTAAVLLEPSPAWNEFVAQHIENFFIAHPAFAVSQGRHEFDGMLPDWSAQGIAREIARLEQVREAAMAFSDEQLHEPGRFQREYLVSSVDSVLFWLDKAQWPFVNPAFYINSMPGSLDPDPYISFDYAPLEVRMEAFTRFAGNIPRAAEQIRTNLRMPMPRTLLQYGIDSFGGMAYYLSTEVPTVFESVEDAALQESFTQANAAAVSALRDLSGWLQSNLVTATQEYALGPELFRQMLYDTERVDLTLEELETMGQADMRRNKIALGEACAEFAPGESIRSCITLMANRKSADGTIESARLQSEESRAFLHTIRARQPDWIFGHLFVSYAYQEGWAHYAEELMIETGFPGASAESRVRQISEALQRNARFLSSIGLHTQGMSVEESERFFREDAYQDEVTATQQAVRGTYDPAYLNDTLGKLMIRELRSDWTAAREGRLSWQDFHETLLSFGGPPIPLIRTRMLETSK